MANISIKGGEKLKAKLKTMAAALGKAHSLAVGYQDGATFPDGTNVAMVAAIQNYGAPGASIPPRPFFSSMVRSKSPSWPDRLGRNLKGTGWNGVVSLQALGQEISEDLQDSVRNTVSPALSPVTVMLRDMRSKGGAAFVMTGATVGEAARKVAAGESNHGASTKPLIDTPGAHLLNTVTVKVD